LTEDSHLRGQMAVFGSNGENPHDKQPEEKSEPERDATTALPVSSAF